MLLRCLVIGVMLVQGFAVQLQAQSGSHRLLAKFNHAVDYEVTNPSLSRSQYGMHLSPLYPQAAPTGRKKQEDVSLPVLITVDATVDREAAIAWLSNTGLFAYVEPDAIGTAATVTTTVEELPNDVGFAKQWSLYNDGTFRVPAKERADIHMPEAWAVQQGNRDIVVAILDTGVKTDHTELSERLWRNSGEIPENGIDDDNNGYVDDVLGWNFERNSHNVADDAGHGTHVAGIIGAQGDNTIGYSGVDWNCRLMVCKVLAADFSGYYSWWAKAIHYAVDNGARVINMSLGGKDFSRTLEEAVAYAYNHNVLVVASMQNMNSSAVYYPAGHAAAFAVGSTDPDDTRSIAFSGTLAGSNYGPHIDLVAPGNYMYGLSWRSDTDLSVMLSGTSQASPLVSGVAALLWAQQPTRTVGDVEMLLTATADDRVGNPREDVTGWDPFYGYGRLNAWRALTGDTNPNVKQEDILEVHPVPTTSVLTVQLPMREASPVTVSLYDMRGTGIIQHTLDECRVVDCTFDLNAIPPGIYQLVLTARGNRWLRRVVVR